MAYIDRVQRLKDARTEAQKEIEEYRKSKDTEFAKIEEKVRPPSHSHSSFGILLSMPDTSSFAPFPSRPQTRGATANTQSEVDRDTETKLLSVTEAFNKNKDSVVKKLLDRVVLVEPKLHRNLTKQ